MPKVHQLPLIRGLKNGVTHVFSMGEQPKSPIPLGGFHGVIRQSRMTTLRTDKIIVLGPHQWMTWNKAAHRIDPEEFFREGDLVDSRQVGEGETSPAKAEGAGTGVAGFLDQRDQF